MAGGTFDPKVKKVRPGNYINFESDKVESSGSAVRGITAIPLFNHNYGPVGEFIKLTNAAPDAAYAMLGYSVYDNELLLVKEAFKKASTVYVYIVAGAGTQATGSGGGVSATAKYAGTRGNDLKFSIVANPVAGFDVTVYLGGAKVSNYEGVTSVADLVSAEDEYVTFTAAEGAELAEIASVALAGGTCETAATKDYTDFLDAIEGITLNSFAFPITGESAESLKSSVKAKVNYLWESCGKRVHAAVPDFKADCEFIINVTNGVVLSDGTEIDNVKACAWVAAAYAGASYTTSNTYALYEGAVDIIGNKLHEEAVAAINNGEFFFSFSEAGDVVVEYDINSLVTFTSKKDSSYRKNRVQRVFDNANSLYKTTFPPNKYDNNETGWNVMEGLGASLHLAMQEDGAIKNVDEKNDFLVDRAKSEGDNTYFDVYLQPVDSSEKLYFQVRTN
ncbi:MAG: phage tail sheath subtilisin-like domain-containing protein [Oscillospiraceae bacterium]|nr:phage tail sheath subtilisin-like domain-containing protein [Oscillospiraceae bacterium]